MQGNHLTLTNATRTAASKRSREILRNPKMFNTEVLPYMRTAPIPIPKIDLPKIRIHLAEIAEKGGIHLKFLQSASACSSKLHVFLRLIWSKLILYKSCSFHYQYTYILCICIDNKWGM